MAAPCRHLATTLLGFGIAAAVAIPLALLVSARPFLDAVLSPFIFAAYSMPKIVLAPALILWLGIGQLPAIALSAVTAFFLVFFNLYLGLKNVPRIYTDVAALMGASARDTALKFRLPAAAAYLATGISQGLIYAFHGTLVGEMTSSDTGMGYLILFAGSKMDSTGVVAGLCIVGLLAVLLDPTAGVHAARDQRALRRAVRCLSHRIRGHWARRAAPMVRCSNSTR